MADYRDNEPCHGETDKKDVVFLPLDSYTDDDYTQHLSGTDDEVGDG